MALRDMLRSRLALRIYLVGLAQFATILSGFITLHAIEEPRNFAPFQEHHRAIAALVANVASDEHALHVLLQNTQATAGMTLSVFGPGGALLATSALDGAPPSCRPFEPDMFRPRLPRFLGGAKPPPGPPCHAELIRLADGREGRVEIISNRPDPPPPPISGTRVILVVLVVVGVSSWLLARTLTKPLRRLTNAARAFGRGDLKTRVALPNRDELGEVSAAFDEMAERVTDLLHAEKELLANVSHELRTPLARIRMALALASEAEGDVVALRESITDITADLDELEQLISDILTTARLELETQSSSGGAPPLRREQVDVSNMLSRAASRFRAKTPNRPLSVVVPDRLPDVDGDAVLLRRVIDNLLENADKYTPIPDAPIQLVARAENKCVVVEVIDKGKGIAKEDLKSVFRPFFRVDKSRTRATGALGLGLALSKQIIDAHGGQIEIESVLHEGTCVRVILPQGAAQMPVPLPIHSSPSLGRRNP